MKNNKTIIALIIILSIFAIGLSIAFVAMLRGEFTFGRKSFYQQLVFDETYSNTFKTLKIDSDASDIEIKSTNDDSVHVMIYGDKERTNVSTDGSTISIKATAQKCIGFCFNTKVSKVIVYLPASYEGEMNINNKFGDINVEDFKNATVIVKEDCGDVEVLDVKNLDIENSYGDIKIGRVGMAKIKEKCGDVEVDYAEEIDIENNYGDIEVKKVFGYIAIQEDCGDVEIGNVNLTKNSSIKNSFGDIKIGSTNDIYFDASVSLGDIKIRNNYRNADVTLTIKNDCGDIEVNN